MGKKYELPKKIVSATESDTDATDVGATDITAGGEQQVLPHSFPIPTTNFRRDFEDAAAQLKEKMQIGTTPVRKEKPKSTLKFNKKGYLEGEIDSVDEGTGKPDTIDLSKQAKTVNEGVKRPVFKKKSAQPKEDEVGSQETMLGTSSGSGDGPVKDERESKDKEPKEAVACETRGKRKYPAFNKKEQDFIDAGDASAVRRAVANKSISRIRGNQILDTMGALENIETGIPATENAVPAFGAIIDRLSDHKTAFADCIDNFNLQPDENNEYPLSSFVRAEITKQQLIDWIDQYPQLSEDFKYYFKLSATEDASIPQPTDAGKPIDDEEGVEGTAIEGDLVSKYTKKMTPERMKEIMADMPDKASAKKSVREGLIKAVESVGGKISFSGEGILEGRIYSVPRSAAEDFSASLKSVGCTTRILSSKESCSVMFEEAPVSATERWYALVRNKNNSSAISQLTLTVSKGATEAEVRSYLEKNYGKGNVARVATEKF